MNLKKILSSVGVGAGAIIIGLGVQYASAQWSAAPSSPPSNNVPAPINVGSSYQAKAGGLTLGASTASSSIPLDVEGIGYVEGLIVGQNSGSAFQYLDGNQGAGKVLTSDANGNASWVAASQSSAGTHGIQAYMTPGTYTWTVPVGVTNATVEVWGGGGSGTRCSTYSEDEGCVVANGVGGGYAESVVVLTPGSTHSITVGAPATVGAPSQSSFDTTVIGVTNVIGVTSGTSVGQFTVQGSSDGQAAGGGGGAGSETPGGGGLGSSFYSLSPGSSAVPGAGGGVVIQY